MGVSSPTNEQNVGAVAATIGTKTSGMMDNDDVESLPVGEDDIISLRKGKTSGLTAEDLEEDPRDAFNVNDDEDDSNDGDYVPDELLCSEEEDYDNLPGIDDDDEFFTSFPKNKSPNINRIEGGPTKPNVSNMSDDEANRTLKDYKVARKKYTDGVRIEHVKLMQMEITLTVFVRWNLLRNVVLWGDKRLYLRRLFGCVLPKRQISVGSTSRRS